MRFLCLVFAVLLLVSLAAPGYGKLPAYRKTCAPVGYCSPKCRVMDLRHNAGDCKHICCVPRPWKGY